MARAALLLAASLLLLPATAAARPGRQAFLPAHGVLIAGKSLAGVGLGASQADVLAAWGTRYDVCDGCKLTTWTFLYATAPVGAAVMFDRTGHAVAVFTLGQPLGWRTKEGLQLGMDVHDIVAMYDAPSMDYKACVGFSALSVRQGRVVTSILTQAEQVYGFALTVPEQTVCL
jgi:hypothetical protein